MADSSTQRPGPEHAGPEHARPEQAEPESAADLRAQSGWRAYLDALWTVLDRVGLLLVFLALSGFGLLSAQGQDVLRAITEGGADWYLEPPPLLFVGGLLLFASSLWFWSRLLLGLRVKEGPPYPGELALRRHLPRVLAAAALAVPALAAALVGAPRPALLAGLLALLALALFLLGGPERGFLWQPRFRLRRWRGTGALLTGSQATRGELAVLALSLGLLLAGLLAFTFGPATLGMGVGMAGVLAFWAATMVPVAALLDLLADVKRLPVLAALIIVALLFSLWNDNHDVRRTAGVEVAGLRSLSTQFQRWLSAREAERAAAGLAGPVPVVLVASEGGGIRSAYWTAAILAEMQDRHPGFARHLFAISGVSGGSLGAAVFAAQIANITPPEGARDGICPRLRPAAAGEAAAEPHRGPLRRMAQEVLGRDYLTPILAGLLYPDLLQRFLPVPVAAFDRARTFELAWEAVWDEACGLGAGGRSGSDAAGANPLAAPLHSLWQGARETRVPSLLFNTTRVETGQRALVSNLEVSRRGAAFAEVLPLMTLIALQEDAADRASLPTITAANLSARFPVVSPVGGIELKLAPIPFQAQAPREYLRFADGGYYENSGAATLRDLLGTVLREGGARVAPIVVQISNDPDALWPPQWLRDAAQAEAAARLDETPGRPLAGELLSPLRTLLNTRSARGNAERETLRSFVLNEAAGPDAPPRGAYLHFRLCQSEGRAPPLGWYLSEETQTLIDRHLRDPETCAAFGVDNVAALARLERLIGPRADRPPNE